MTDTEFVRGTWPGAVTWVAHRATNLSLPKPLLANWQLCSGAGVVVLHDSRSMLPYVVMTRQKEGRHGEPPRDEIPSGKLQPGESPEQAARREVMEEVGAWLDKIKIYAYVEILSATGGVAYMVHYVGHTTGRLAAPRHHKHIAKIMAFEQIGKLARRKPPDVSELDAKLVREAAIAAGCPAKLVKTEMGWLG